MEGVLFYWIKRYSDMHPMLMLACAVAIGLSILVITGVSSSFYIWCYPSSSAVGRPMMDVCPSFETGFYYSLGICIPIIGLAIWIFIRGVNEMPLLPFKKATKK